MKYNLHTHTVRCFHAQGSDEEYVLAAIKSGYKELGFSDHCPYIFPDEYVSHMRMEPDSAEDYVSSIRYLGEKYMSDIDIKVGFEMEWYPALIEKQREFLKTLDIDYLILGQHFTENEYEEASIYVGSKTFSNKVVDKYISQLLDGAKSGLFTYVCHPDVINYIGAKRIYDKKIGDMLTELKALDLPIEYNFLGYSENRWYPNDRFWRLAKEVGNDVVIGMDAHEPELLKADDLRNRMIAHLTDDLGITPLEKIKIIKPKF